MSNADRFASASAMKAYPCKPECQDALCLCDENTRHLRLVHYSARLRELAAELEDVNRRLREDRLALLEEIDGLDAILARR